MGSASVFGCSKPSIQRLYQPKRFALNEFRTSQRIDCPLPAKGVWHSSVFHFVFFFASSMSKVQASMRTQRTIHLSICHWTTSNLRKKTVCKLAQPSLAVYLAVPNQSRFSPRHHSTKEGKFLTRCGKNHEIVSTSHVR